MKTLLVIPEQIQMLYILERHIRKVQLCNTTHDRLRESRNKCLESLIAYSAINNLDAVLKTSYIKNEIYEADLAIQESLQIILTVDEM